jgi:hypothetical protein
MSCVPFRLLSPAEYALRDIQKHLHGFRADNMRLLQWALRKDRR